MSGLEAFRASRQEAASIEDGARATSGEAYGLDYEDQLWAFEHAKARKVFLYVWDGGNHEILETPNGFEWCWIGKGLPDFEPTLEAAEAKLFDWVGQ